eukprot:Gb_00617 [translate_table: standard]
MELGAKVIVVHQDGHGAGTRIANALHPNPSSPWKRKETPLELPLESYGLTDISASGKVINFVDSHDVPQVSLILLQDYKAPTSACVAYEVLKLIIARISGHSSSFPVIFPCVTIVPKSLQKLQDSQIADLEQSLYAAEMNEASDFSKAITRGLPKLPPTAQICDDLLACMLHFIHILQVPAVLLLAPTARISPLDSNGAHVQQLEESQMLCKLGDLLANQTGLQFSKEKLESTPIWIQKGAEDDWRRLYG